MNKSKTLMTLGMLIFPLYGGNSNQNNNVFKKDIIEREIKKILEPKEIQQKVILDTITIDKALEIIDKKPEKYIELHINHLIGSKNPFNYQYNKEYIFVHGGANITDKALIYTGHSTGDFAYAILKNGQIIQFFDSSLGSGAIGAFGGVNGDALSGVKGIAIEFSADYKSELDDVEEPNEYQLHNGTLLLNYLKEKHNINKIYTSWQSVQNVPYPYNKYIHIDTKNWSREILDVLGVGNDELTDAYDSIDIDKRLEIVKQITDSLQDIDPVYVNKSYTYWNSLKNK